LSYASAWCDRPTDDSKEPRPLTTWVPPQAPEP